MGNKPIKEHPERIDRVYKLMERENLTQSGLARAMGVPQQRVSEFLRTRKLSDYYLGKISEAFPDYFPKWFEGHGDINIATKEDELRHKFDNFVPQEEDSTNLITSLEELPSLLLNDLKMKLNMLQPIYRIKVLKMLNELIEPYTMIKEWEE